MSTALREIAAVFGIEFDDEQLKRGTESINGGIKMLQQFAAVLAGSAVVQGIRSFAEGFERQASAIQDSADRLGVSAQELQELQYAAQLGGVGAEELGASLAVLSRQAVAAAQGSGAAAAAFRTLGVSTRAADGSTRPVADLMGDLAQGLDGVEDPAQRVALAQTLLGRSGRNLLTVLKDGEGGLAALRGQFRELGGGIDDATLAIAGQFGDAMDRWHSASLGIQSQIALYLLPVLTRLTDWVTAAGAEFHRLTQGTEVVKLGMIALGAAGAAAALPILAAWAPVLLPFAAVAAGAALTALAVDDLITFFRGGDSVLGRFIDKLYGIGTSKKFVHDLRAAFEGAKLAVRDFGVYLDGVQHRAEKVGAFLSKIFGGVGESIRGAFSSVFDWIDEHTGGLVTRIVNRIREQFAANGGLLGTIAQAAIPGLGLAVQGARAVGQIAQVAGVTDAAGEYMAAGRKQVQLHTLGATSGFVGKPSAAAAAAGARTVHAPITIHSNQNPEAIARAVARKLRQAEHTDHDGGLPRGPGEE